jgi:glycerol-3-phosphate dehydrogenase
MNERDMSVDLLIIGGGISGAGIAQDAAARGLKTALVEKGDFGSGTSSRSSKLIHGGLRYLEHFSLGLMRESIVERHTLARLAPGLVRWTPFLLPHYQGKTNRWIYSAGLWLYDYLARTRREHRHRMLGPAATLAEVRGLRRSDLTGGALFYDCVTDDARLVLSLVLDAQSRGAVVRNYTIAEELIHENERAAGAAVRDLLTGESWKIHARQVVVTAGPWTDVTLMRLGDTSKQERIRPAKGVHVVLQGSRLPLRQTILIPSARDRRFLFVIPWYEGVVVGTTDTEYRGDPDEVAPERDDIQYILDALNWSFPEERIGLKDLVSSYAGIRPLINAPGKKTADVPREYRVFESRRGVIAVAGGKLTTYRVMARLVVNRVVRLLRSKSLDRVIMPSWTHRIRLGNPPEGVFDPFGKIDLPQDVRDHLVADYGTWSRQIVSILEVHPEWNRRICEGLPYILAEVYFAVTHERARTLEDVLCRRMRVTLLDPVRGRDSLRAVCETVAPVLNWGPEEVAEQMDSYENALPRKFPGARDFL